ncbi:MAG: hypothetical protein ACU84J_16230, partial [Gammaproteobacteria bacterium]
MKPPPYLNKPKTRSVKQSGYSPREIENITPEDIQCLIYELQVHQIELEMQNEELLKAQHELTEVNNRLHFIYHQVPVGILTLNQKGFIEDANYEFARMLHTDVGLLINKPFSRYIVKDDLFQFILRFDAFFKYPDRKHMRLRLQSEKSEPVQVLIKATADDGADLL